MLHHFDVKFLNKDERRNLERWLKAHAGSRGHTWSMSKPRKVQGNIHFNVQIEHPDAAIQFRLTYADHVVAHKTMKVL